MSYVYVSRYATETYTFSNPEYFLSVGTYYYILSLLLQLKGISNMLREGIFAAGHVVS